MAKISKPFHINKFQTPEELAAAMRSMNLDIPMSKDLSVFGRPITTNGRTLANSICINPLETVAADAKGAPTELVFRKYAAMAGTGAGILWFEATGIRPEGRSAKTELFLNQENVPVFRELTELVDKVGMMSHGCKPFKIMQLSHAGRASHAENGEAKPLAVFNSPYLDKYYPGVQIVTDEYIDGLIESIGDAAVYAMEAGFDAVDLKPCHDFLLREFLAAYTRPGKYGGSYENRTLFLKSCIENVKRKTRGGIEMVVRINAYDSIPYPYGWGMEPKAREMRENLDEPIRLIRELYDLGIHIFSISTMFPRFAPRGYGYEINFMKDEKLNPYVGSSLLLEATRRIKRMVPDAILVSSGLSWYEQFSPYVGAGGIAEGWFDVAGYGRQALADPNFVTNLLEGRMPDPDKACRTCDGCIRMLMTGWPCGCARNDELYNKLYRIAMANAK